ncbi:MAG: hypothetical protein ACOY32_04525 [Thermodesulfobacteriota bacterium]
MKDFPAGKKTIIIPGLIVVVGFLLRLYAFFHSHAVNADGMLYIQQAKAFHYGLYDSLTQCYGYLHSYFVLISLAYPLFDDWVMAAKAVSLGFATLTMVPLYLLLRRFLAFPIAAVTLLVFAVNPALIEMSVKIIRDPCFWFFLTTGLSLFVLHDRGKDGLLLALSSLSFLLAALARFEAVVFIGVSLLFLVFTRQDDRWRKISWFCLPLAGVILLTLLTLPVLEHDLRQWIYPRSVLAPFFQLAERYGRIRLSLEAIGVRESDPFWQRHFFPTVGNLMWWLGLGSVLVTIVRTFFEPFFLFFLFGLKGVRPRIAADRMLGYLLLLGACTFAVLFLHELGNWTMRGRFVVFFVIPTFVVIGFGVENLFSCFGPLTEKGRRLFFLLLGLVIFVVPLAKNLNENRQAARIFEEIGVSIARAEKGGREVMVAGALASDELQLVAFFANLPARTASCAHELARKIDPRQIGADRRWQEGVRYLLWDEKNWSSEELAGLRRGEEFSCSEIGQWRDKRLGEIVLFRINDKKMF